MPPKKGPPTPNKPPKNPNWTLDEGEEMRRDINELQKKMYSMEAKLDTKMDSMEDKLDTKMDGLKGEIMEVVSNNCGIGILKGKRAETFRVSKD